jgi:hypothetical protein
VIIFLFLKIKNWARSEVLNHFKSYPTRLISAATPLLPTTSLPHYLLQSAMLTSSISKPFLSSASLRLLSPTRCRSLACSAHRIDAQPPDLIRWARREGGSVHPNLTIGDQSDFGLGVVSAGEIPAGSELINLPSHLPLRWNHPVGGNSDGADAVLTQLSEHIPGIQISLFCLLICKTSYPQSHISVSKKKNCH